MTRTVSGRTFYGVALLGVALFGGKIGCTGEGLAGQLFSHGSGGSGSEGFSGHIGNSGAASSGSENRGGSGGSVSFPTKDTGYAARSGEGGAGGRADDTIVNGSQASGTTEATGVSLGGQGGEDGSTDSTGGIAAGAGGEGGAPPEGPRCDTTSSFTSQLDGVFLFNGYVRTRLLPDELTAYFSFYDTAGASWQIGMGLRSSRQEPFTSLWPITSVNSVAIDLTPFVTVDGLELYLESTRGGADRIYGAFRSSLEEPFGTPMLLPGVSEVEGQIESGGPFLSVDAQTLYFQMATPQKQDLYQTVRSADGWADPQPVLSIGATVAFPVVTSDELTVYFAVRSEVDGEWDIWVARRTTTNEAFNNAVELVELNTAESEFPTWISPDDCRLYFDRGPGSSWVANTVMVAEREPSLLD